VAHLARRGALVGALASVAVSASLALAQTRGIDLDVRDIKGEGGALEGRRVSSAEELNAVLRDPTFTGRVIVPSDARFNLTGFAFYDPIPIRSGVQLVGEPGPLGKRPLLYTLDKTASPPQPGKGRQYHLFEVMGNDVQVVGLHIRGPWRAQDHKKGIDRDKRPYTHGIRVNEDAEQGSSGRNVIIADNEFERWSGAGVTLAGTHNAHLGEWKKHAEWKHLNPDDARLVRIVGNYMHENVMDGGGYGVMVNGGAYATVEGNVFDLNRHAVAADGDAYEGYVARFNYVLEGGTKASTDRWPDHYNQHFDVHGDDSRANGDGYGGWAGEYFDIASNTIRGEQKYGWLGFRATRPAFMLRGKAHKAAYFRDNIVVHDNLDEAVSLKKRHSAIGIGEHHDAFNFAAGGNVFDTDYSKEIAAGDFDGDGRTDVFVATGTAWFYSRAGIRPWEYLRPAGQRIADLAFADIDNDKVADVLWRDGRERIGYSKAARQGFLPLADLPVPIGDVRFGDFDGDSRTDMFYTARGQWNVWYAKTREWTKTQTSSKPISELLFGEFDDVTGTDVVGVNRSGWEFSSASTDGWKPLNTRLTRSFKNAVAANFDGLGKTDIAVDEGNAWRYSAGGRGALVGLLPSGAYKPLKNVVIGRFHEPPAEGGAEAELVTFSDRRLAHWSRGERSFARLSEENMR
jgi:hypothetical protein